jgi:hypothetical protein
VGLSQRLVLRAARGNSHARRTVRGRRDGTLFHVAGAYIYVDPDGDPTGVEDVFTKIARARKHYESVGLGADYVNQFIR